MHGVGTMGGGVEFDPYLVPYPKYIKNGGKLLIKKIKLYKFWKKKNARVFKIITEVVSSSLRIT